MTANEWRRKYGQGKKPEENSSSSYSPARGETASAADEWRRKYGRYVDSYRSTSRRVERDEAEPAAQAKVKAKGKDRSWEEAVSDYTAEEEKPNFWQRLLNIGEAAIAGTGADYASFASTWREAGMSPSEDMVNIALDNYLREQAREQTIIDEYEAGLGEWTEWDYEEAKRQRENLQFYIDAYSKASGVEAQAPELFRQSEEELTAVSAEKTAKAKQGLGTAGQFLVDAGVAGVQMLADTATGGGATAMPSMMARVFGGKAREGREKGYTVEQQVATGAAAATITYLTEMLGENPLMGEHGSLVDDIIERYLAPSSPAVAKLMNIPAQSIGEGLEEVAENILTELSDYLIVGDRIEIDPEELGREGLIGATLGGAGQVVNTAATEAVNAAVVNPQTKKIYGEPEAEAALVQEALSLNPKSKYAQRLQKILDSGEHLSGNQLRQLAELNESAAARAADTKRAETIEEETTAEVMAEDGETVVPAEAAVEAEEMSEAVPVLSADEEARRVMDAVYKEGQDRAAFEQAFTFAREIGKGKGKREYLDSAETLNVLSDGQKDAAYETGRNEANRVELPKLANVEIEDGQTVLVRQDGQKISAEEAYVPGNGGRDVVEAVSTMDLDGKAALSVLRGYSGKVSPARYVDAMQEAYRQGRVGVPVSAKSLLPKAAQTAVYEAGVRAGEAETEAAQARARSGSGKRAKGGVRLLGMEESGMKDTQRAGYDAARLIGQALGANITMVEGYNRDGKRYFLDENGEEHEFAGGGKNLNGWYNPSTGEIYLDVNAGKNYSGTVLFTLAHEMTHFIKQWSPAKYRTMSGYLFEQLAARGENVETLIQRKMAATGQSYEVAAEEVVADAMETILVSGNVAETIAEIRQKDASLADKILQFLKDFVAKLKASLQAYRGVAPDSTEGRMVAELEEDVIRKLEQLWAEAAVEAGDAYSRAEQALETGNRYSDRDAEYLRAVENGDMVAAQRKVNAAAEAAMPNSKIRDKSGNLLPVYHGTKDLFYIFDTSIKGGANGTAEVFGIYTTDNPGITASYGDRQIKMYANITKPASSEQKTINRRVLAALIKDTCERQARQMVADDEYDSVEDAIMDTWVSNYVYTYELGMDRAYRETADAIIWQNKSDMAIVHEIMAGMAIRDYATAFKFYRESLTPITGFDGIATKWHDSNTGEDSGIYLAFDSSQLKSADPVTFDNSGNVIPLSERFDENTGDIRFSVRRDAPNDFNPDGKTLEEQLDDVLKTASSFDGRYLYIGEFTAQFIEKVAAFVKIEQLPIAMNYRDAYLSMQDIKHGKYKGKGINYHGLGKEGLKSAIEAIADPEQVLLSKKEGKVELVLAGKDKKGRRLLSIVEINTTARNGKKYIRAHIVASVYGKRNIERYVATAEEEGRLIYEKEEPAQGNSQVQYEGIINANSSFKAKVPQESAAVKTQARPMESVSNRELLANALDSAVQNEAEQRRLDEYRAKIDSLNEQQARLEELNAQIREKSFARGPRDTEGLNALRSEKVKTQNRINTLDGSLLRLEATKPLQALLERQKASAYARAREEGRQALADYRAKADERLAETKKKYQEQRRSDTEKRRERDARNKYKARIQKDVADLNNWLLHPSGKDAMKHIPDVLKKPIVEFISGIDFSSERRLKGGEDTAADRAFIEQLTAVKRVLANNQSNEDKYAAYLDLPPDFMEQVDEFVDTANRMAMAGGETNIINRMSASELQDLSGIVKVLKNLVQSFNRFHANAMYQNAYEAGDNSIAYMGKLKDAGKNVGGLNDFVVWQNIRPAYAFERFGRGGEAIYDGLRRGQAKLAFNAKEIIDFAEKAYTSEEIKDWEDEVKEVELGGDIVKIPVSHLMSFYELSKRPQALTHILGEGVRVATYKKGGKKISDNGHMVTPGEVRELIGLLTDRQREVADNLQQFMAEQGGKWGNYVSTARFGEDLFGEKEYFPINSDGRHLMATADESPSASSLYALLNMSFTKELKKNANNRLILYSIFDVFANHMSSMAQYNALALPMVDALKWLNYKQTDAFTGELVSSVRDQMDRAYGVPEEGIVGRGQQGYAQKFVIDILKAFNGTEAQNNDAAQGLVNLLKRYNYAQVAWNLSVVVQQPTSIARAGLLLNPKDIGKGMTTGALKKNIAEMEKYSGIALWKSMGFYDVNVSRGVSDLIKHKQTARDKYMEIGMAGAEAADKATWAAIWNACKAEVTRKHGLKPEGDAFFELVAKRFEEVIYKTQVVDSVLTRSSFLRNKGVGAKMFSSFMSEPTTTASMIIHAAEQMNREARTRGGSFQKAWKKIGPFFGRATAVYVIQAAVNAAIHSALVGAPRDDDDYQNYWDKFLEHFREKLLEELMPLDKLPYFSEAVEIVKQLGAELFNWDVYATPQQTVIGNYVSPMLKLSTRLGEIIHKKGTNYTMWASVFEGLKVAGNLTGFSLYQPVREIQTIWNNIVGRMAPSLKITTYDAGAKNEIKYSLLDGYISEEEAAAYLLEQGEAEDEEEAEDMVGGWLYNAENPDADISWASYRKWQTYAEPAGISEEMFQNVLELKTSLTGSGSVKEPTMEYIDGLAITDEQKDALYFAMGWSENTLDEAPWH